MKVLLVVHQFFPDFSAGTEVLTLGVARELRRRGHLVHILSGHPGHDDLEEWQRCVRDRFDDFEISRFHHAYVPMGGQRSMIEVGSDNKVAARFFQQILQEFRPDCIHYFHLNRLGTGLIAAADAAGIVQSLTPTDFWTICPTAQLRYPDGSLCTGPSRHAGNCVKHFAQNPVRARWVRELARRVPTGLVDAFVPLARGERGRLAAEVRALDQRLPKTIERLNRLRCVVAPNAFMRAKLIEYGVDPARVVEIAFGVDLPAHSASGSLPTHVPDRLRIGFIGTLAPHKGAHVLLGALRQLPAARWTAVIYGNLAEFPDYAQELQALSADLPGVTFAGTFPSDVIFDVLADVDVLVVPSLWYENTPLVVYSAQAAKKLIVASDHPGIAAAVRHDVDGLLFPAGDAQALAQLLVRLAQDPDLRARLRAQVKPPRSVADYVDDLLQRWSGD